MRPEPTVKRTVAFFDGQNLYRQAKEAFGCSHPDYSPLALAAQVCNRNGFNLHEIRFYTGIPSYEEDPFWNKFWAAKLLALTHQGIKVFSRPLRYRPRTIQIGQGVEYSTVVPEEKGIDVRIAIDIMRAVRKDLLDVALVFSQDQDFSEVADEVRAVAQEQNRWIKIVSAFPVSRNVRNKRGINKTDWIRIDRDLYNACIDKRDYRSSQ